MKPSKVGVVISQGKMDKTVKIRIRKVNWNRHVSKNLVSYRTMLVHDELNKCREGDVVRVQYVRPLSARKSWAVAEFKKLQGTSWQKYKDEIPGHVQADELRKFQEFEQRTSQPVQESSELDVERIERSIAQVSEQLNKLSFMSAEAKRILQEEPDRADEIIRSAGRDPTMLNPSIKRNIILKHIRS